MKESPRRYTNPFLSDEENEKVNLWSNQEVQNSNIEDNLTNNYEETEFYTDKSVMECELPELLVCYKEDAFHVKDICVDEGIITTHEDRILFDDNNNEILKPEMSTIEEDYYMESKIDTNLAILKPTNDLIDIEKDQENDAAKECGTHEEVIDSVSQNEIKIVSKIDTDDEDGITESAPDKFNCSPESDTVTKVNENCGPDINSGEVLLDNVSTEKVVSNTNSGPALQLDKQLPSLKSLLESIDQQPCQNPAEETSKNTNISNETPADELNNTSNINNSKPLTNNSFQKPENLQDVGPDNGPTANPVNRGEFESSFSVAGPVSGQVTYSGPIAFSGSISLRSDSSTTSTRSFAFPILQNEWNSSPVRMAKADRRRLQKQRGWGYGLLCCKF